MPITTRCPSCDRPLRLPEEYLGQEVRCPACQATFTAEGPPEQATAPPPPVAAEVVPDATDRPPARPSFSDLRDDEFDDYADPYRRGRLRERALAAVSGPAIALMVTGIITIGLGFLNVVLYTFLGAGFLGGPGPGRGGPDNDPEAVMAQTVIGVVVGVLALLCGGITLAGGIQLKSLKSRGWAMAGSITAMIPCVSCCLLGLPFGIWALVVMNRPEVADAFGRYSPRSGDYP